MKGIFSLVILTAFTFATLLLSNAAIPSDPQRVTFQGAWNTTNRKLDGRMTCDVTRTANQQWSGRFYGIWQGVRFDYTVAFTGPPSALRGTATIDGAHYDWTGEIEQTAPRRFRGTFGGDRYLGSFDLIEQPPTPTSAR